MATGSDWVPLSMVVLPRAAQSPDPGAPTGLDHSRTELIHCVTLLDGLVGSSSRRSDAATALSCPLGLAWDSAAGPCIPSGRPPSGGTPSCRSGYEPDEHGVREDTSPCVRARRSNTRLSGAPSQLCARSVGSSWRRPRRRQCGRTDAGGVRVGISPRGPIHRRGPRRPRGPLPPDRGESTRCRTSGSRLIRTAHPAVRGGPVSRPRMRPTAMPARESASMFLPSASLRRWWTCPR